MNIRKQTALWTTRLGGKIRICDMTDNHLLAAIKIIESKFEHMKSSAPPQFQGDMAQFYADQEWNYLQDADITDYFPIYEKLILDADRRNILEGSHAKS